MAVLFDITHDDNNLDEYDSLVTDGGDLSTGTPGLALTTAKMEALVDGPASIHGTKNLSVPASGKLRNRFYLDASNFTGPGGLFYWAYLHWCRGDLWVVELQKTAGDVYQLVIYFYDDVGLVAQDAVTIDKSQEYYVEIYVVQATTDVSSDGSYQWWVNGALQGTWSGRDNYDKFALLTWVRLGVHTTSSPGGSGTIYLDELKANDDGSEIGPAFAAPAEAGFACGLGLILGGWRSAPRLLEEDQKTLGGEPVVTLTIGSHSLDAFVWGYRYEENDDGRGGLLVWLDNRNDEFDDLATDYTDLKRGAAIDLRRGLPVKGVNTTAKLPRTWIDELRYVFIEGAALLQLRCIAWRDRLGFFRYDSKQEWSATEARTIAASILGQVSLTLAAGDFSFETDFTISPRRDADGALMDVMERVDETLYVGEDGEIQHKQLDPDEAAGYAYDWSAGGVIWPRNHPLLRQSAATGDMTEVAETSPRYNAVSVIGGPDGEYSGSASDATEAALVGTRRRTLTDDALGSDAQCTERARAELRRWQAGSSCGLIVARPHFSLRLYDVVSVAAPPWGGPALTGRVMGYVEEYGRGRGIWEQRIRIGGATWRGIGSQEIDDGVVITAHVDAQPVAAQRYQIREGDGSEILLAMTAVEDPGVGTTSTLEIRGKDGDSPEGYAELVAITTDGLVHGGVASVTISLDTQTGVIDFGGGVRCRLNQVYLEMTEQGGDPDAPGVNRCRLFLRDNGGKTELCARFNTGAIQQVAIEP